MDLDRIMLGTAMWGWTVTKEVAFQLLDLYYEQGYRLIDAATNYPLNNQKQDFRRSEKILQEWIGINNVKDLQVNVKIGSLTNIRTPDHNLRPSFIKMNWEYYKGWLGDNLHTLMFHWDNRDDSSEIQASFEMLNQIAKAGYQVGFSGIKHAAVYAEVLQQFDFNFTIQLKHNLIHSDLPRYTMFQDQPRFYTYGINAGGLKMDSKSYHQASSLKVRGGNVEEVHPASKALCDLFDDFNKDEQLPKLSKMNQAAMIFALYTPKVKGVLMGPSKIAQLQDSLDWLQLVDQHDWQLFYDELLKIHREYAPKERRI